jgi:hypothetical protein
MHRIFTIIQNILISLALAIPCAAGTFAILYPLVWHTDYSAKIYYSFPGGLAVLFWAFATVATLVKTLMQTFNGEQISKIFKDVLVIYKSLFGAGLLVLLLLWGWIFIVYKVADQITFVIGNFIALLSFLFFIREGIEFAEHSNIISKKFSAEVPDI